ncbi:hypothetical protein [Streptococcus suis]
MSYEWIKNRIHEDDFANPEDYFRVKQAIDKGNYEAVLSKVDIDGNVSHFRLDMDANIIGTWP